MNRVDAVFVLLFIVSLIPLAAIISAMVGEWLARRNRKRNRNE